MSLKTRLRRLQEETGSAAGASSLPPVNGRQSLQTRLRRLGGISRATKSAGRQRHCSVQELARLLGGTVEAQGVICIQEQLPPSAAIGNQPLLGGESGQHLPGEESSEEELLYIDTETTGLSGGSGTLAFLVGLAARSDDGVRLTQLLITGFNGEQALLSRLRQLLAGAGRLASYNGKCFDLPLLAGRFGLHRTTHHLETMPHLDLLYPVRRLFGDSWRDCRLQTAEQKLLGLKRHNDLPGAEAPAAWFDYLRRGEADRLIRVVEHNRQDLLSLIALRQALIRLVAEPDSRKVDICNLARWQMLSSEAEALALLQGHKPTLSAEGQRLLASLLRRAGHWDQAAALWQDLASCGCMDSMERLAKYYEHIRKDNHQAWVCTRALPGSAADLHRLRRLEQKIRQKRRQQASQPVSVCCVAPISDRPTGLDLTGKS